MPSGDRPRLIHLNGPPGIGKSTIARRLAAEQPGMLVCDIDVVRTLIGGWHDDVASANRLARPAALAMARAHLTAGHDVVLPQLMVRPDQLARVAAVAAESGAVLREIMLVAEARTVLERFHSRPGLDPWTAAAPEVVAEEGGDEVVLGYHDRLAALIEDGHRATLVRTSAGESEDKTYAAVSAALAQQPSR